MELAETIETINRQLENLFGTDFTSKRPMYRVVWSEDQYEKRMTDTTDEGLQLLYPVVRELPKYRQWIKERYVLEQLVIVPEQNRAELADAMVSYEPLWVFETQDGRYLPPRIDASKIIIDSVRAATGKKSLHKYTDPEGKLTKEEREAEIVKLEEELFGNESEVGDALAHGGGISLSGPKFGEDK